MVKTIKELSKRDPPLVSGHRACLGCATPVIVNQALMEIDNPIVVGTATGCLETFSSTYPFSSWNVPWIHSAFENVSSTISGIEAAYKSFKRRKDSPQVHDDIKFVSIAGDGGTYDIGFQALSGAFERGHDFLHICYNNEAYMNTGIQRSSATTEGAWTTTTETGKASAGKSERSKNLTMIAAEHDIPYAAQASPSRDKDLRRKVAKAIDIKGPTFLNVISPCPLGWRVDPSYTIRIADMGVKTCLWPLYEIEDKKVEVTSLSKSIANDPSRKEPIEKFLEKQGRFKHLFSKENKEVIDRIQRRVDQRWEDILRRCEL